MSKHLYLSLIPEALIASMLSPAEFGSYYAVGTTRKQRGQAMFIEIDLNFRHEHFHIDDLSQSARKDDALSGCAIRLPFTGRCAFRSVSCR